MRRYDHVGDVVVVGSTTAGLAATVELAKRGCRPILVDDVAPGPPCDGPGTGTPWAELAPDVMPVDEAQRVREAVRSQASKGNVRHLARCVVLGAFPDEGLMVATSTDIHRLLARHYIVAPSQQSWRQCFRGWDLQATIAPEDLDKAWASGRIKRGSTVLVAGTDPTQLSIVASLASAGIHVPLIAFTPRGPRSNGQRRLSGSRVTALEQEGGAWRATVTQLGRRGQRIPGKDVTVRVDAAVVVDGYVAATHLTRLLGCEHEIPHSGIGWRAVRDGEMRTSIPNVFVIGEAGMSASIATLQGQIAAAVSARELGRTDGGDDLAALQTTFLNEVTRARARRRRARLPMMDELEDEVIVCRCERVSLGAIRTAAASIPSASYDGNVLKAGTRVGMGRCQGRECEGFLIRLALESSASRLPLTPMTVRPPLRPTPLGILATDAALRYASTSSRNDADECSTISE